MTMKTFDEKNRGLCFIDRHGIVDKMDFVVKTLEMNKSNRATILASCRRTTWPFPLFLAEPTPLPRSSPRVLAEIFVDAWTIVMQ
jgi:hypothetical protein